MIGTVAAAAAAGATVARAHIETVVQHVGNAVHIEILIGSRDLAQCRADNAQIALELTDHGRDLLGIGEHLHAAGVGIVAHTKGTLYAVGKGAVEEEQQDDGLLD